MKFNYLWMSLRWWVALSKRNRLWWRLISNLNTNRASERHSNHSSSQPSILLLTSNRSRLVNFNTTINTKGSFVIKTYQHIPLSSSYYGVNIWKWPGDYHKKVLLECNRCATEFLPDIIVNCGIIKVPYAINIYDYTILDA